MDRVVFPKVASSGSAADSSMNGCRWRTFASSQVDEALAVWRLLEQRIRGTSIACSSTWTDCWLHHYGDLVPSRFLVAEGNGLVRGIALLTDGVSQKLGNVPIRSRHLGTAGEPQVGSVCVEYNRMLVEHGWEDAFHRGLFEHLERDNNWEQLRLDGIDERDLSPWIERFPQSEIRVRDSRYFDLKQARDQGTDAISQLGKSTRANLRRRLRQYGDLKLEWAENVSHADSILKELIELHQARWHAVEEPGAFADNRFRSFQEHVALRLFLERRAVLFRVRQGQETVGCLYLLVDRNRLLDYLSGFVSFDVKPSPGLITHYLCMEEALRRGYDAYDFLVGDKRHKDNLSTHSNRLCWLTWSRPTWKMKSLHLLRTVKRKVSEWKRRVSPSAMNGAADSGTSHHGDEERDR